MLRFGVVAACLAAVYLVAVPARATAAGSARVLVVGLPETEARLVLSSHPAALGLGVFPDSRVPTLFLDEVGFAAPRGLTGTPGPLGGAPGKLARALSAEGIAIETSIAGAKAIVLRAW